MRVILISILTLLSMCNYGFIFSQSINDTIKSTKFEEIKPNIDVGFSLVDLWPMYPGGTAGLTQHIKENLIYPVSLKEKYLEGTVTLSFVIDTLGNIGNIRIISGAYPEMDDEAIRVVSTLDKFLPAIQKGIPVKLMYQQSIHFNINKE